MTIESQIALDLSAAFSGIPKNATATIQTPTNSILESGEVQKTWADVEIVNCTIFPKSGEDKQLASSERSFTVYECILPFNSNFSVECRIVWGTKILSIRKLMVQPFDFCIVVEAVEENG